MRTKPRDPGQKRLLGQLVAELVLQGHIWSSGKFCMSWEKLRAWRMRAEGQQHEQRLESGKGYSFC